MSSGKVKTADKKGFPRLEDLQSKDSGKSPASKPTQQQTFDKVRESLIKKVTGK